ncbi:VOC family protein [Isoptericola sp. NPDC019482]|uniref:VOC family protein n=1 Tax=Isoptericola sp. NPDC019482 TaxID=3154688 RepID=UPI0034844629
MTSQSSPTRRPDLLAAETAMGAVTLHVGDLGAMSAYYREAIALEELPALGAPGRVVLGRGGVPVVALQHTPGLPATSRNQAGLFHTAVLFDTEAALAAAVAHAARHPLSRFAGNSDHWVSRAFYFTDPEDNGIELYWDRPREVWQHDGGGRVAMGSDWFDPQEFLQRHLTEDALAGTSGQAAQVGHVHLQVGDIPTAQRFYVDTLGFEIMATFHGALFVAAGGYHHHMAMNTWNSAGAGPRAATLGLGQVALTVPTRDEVGALADRLKHAGVAARDDGQTLRFDDPWNTLVEVSVA